MRTVNVSLGERSYSILIGSGLLSRLGEECAKADLGRRCAIITDRRVGPKYAKAAAESLRRSGFEPVVIGIAPGESSKNFKTVHSCCEQLAKHRLERKSFLVALGGGVVGDLAGFVAAIHLRGIRFVQVPTTLLAQVDSSVGGKVGVNLKTGKNLVGAFHQPKLVLCDLDTLRTLPKREFRAGLAEVIKYGIIYDHSLFEKLERELPDILSLKADLAEIIARCCEIKADVVRQDETEAGLRQILNFGHTIGHAIEAVSGYGKYLHGEAISIGQVAAARLSQYVLDCPPAEVERVRKVFTRAGLPVSIKVNRPRLQKLLRAMQLDKKVSGGELRFVLMERIGKVRWGQKVPPEMIAQALLCC